MRRVRVRCECGRVHTAVEYERIECECGGTGQYEPNAPLAQMTGPFTIEQDHV